jgi:hypothetical protein
MYIYYLRGRRGRDRMRVGFTTATEVVSSNPVHGEVFFIQHYAIKLVGDRSVVFSRYSGFIHL